MKKKQKLNQLIPMEHADGTRAFVNHWDVPVRKTQGWTVIGDLSRHTSNVLAPVDALQGTDFGAGVNGPAAPPDAPLTPPAAPPAAPKAPAAPVAPKK